MAEENYGALYAAAIAESGLGSETLPDGEYAVKIGTVKPDTTKGGKFKVGVRLQVVGGAFDGKSTWINQSFSPESPKAIAIFIRLMTELGVPQQAVAAGLPPQQLIAYIVQGSTGVATISSHINGVNPDGTPKKWQDLKSFRLTTADGVVAAPVAAAPVAAATAPAPEVAPAVVVEAAPAPVAAPPLPAQPGAVTPGAVPAPF